MQYLLQDLILLALNPQTGKTRFSWYSALDYGLVGSLLLDLARPILRTELRGYKTVGTQVFVVRMGFNQSWVQV
ncbi:GPP34 family phosphoprotein [Rivularia sp. UHCC 0363]|uniref:GPP34 family phosphoprotein n=1 Tax=Rivularia sp. UHCC 0363 TaxID=3110244 RepID=UPI002B1E94A9|nr:GPP34 family phosphoprotein [Rivularia sp. UHCC 0363]MEA5599089.1 GPP34 family phosphoprotein [Rivularia sp. UHCC 0363]